MEMSSSPFARAVEQARSARRPYAYRVPPELHRAEARRVPVVIVGAGPVGLALARDLATHEIPVMVLSHGKNGFGATSDTGIVRATPAGWSNALDEFDNANDSTAFWSRTRSENTGATGGQFDDIVVWIPPGILFSRMVAAGKLP